MPRRTPPIYARGRYTLIMPWAADPAKIYTCQAIRSFSDLAELEIDPFTEFYQPMGLADTVYQDDKALNATIITLTSDNDDEVIYVPDTYIQSFPNMENIRYAHIVLSASIGPVPDYLDLAFLKTQIQNNILDVIGMNTTVNENRVPHSGAVAPLDHDVLETARLANITLQETDHAKAKRYKDMYDSLLLKYNTLQQLAIDGGLIP